jgi:L-glyceraldehyde 3-phosphate reductase
MRYRPFGSTGLEVSELVFGGGAVGGLLINADDNTKQQAIERAVAAGINWIDTAAAYGQGRSEEALGWLLAGHDDIHVSTKFTIDTRDLSDVAGQIEASLTGSLERLQRSSVTLLQLHNQLGSETRGRMISADEVLRPGGVIDGLERLREQGLIEHFGVTALGETPAISRVIASGRIASAQVYFNLLNPSAGWTMPASWPVHDFGGVLDACQRHAVAAMNIRVFSAGVIATGSRTGRERPLTPGDTVESETAKAHTVFAALGDRYGSRAQTAIRFALSEPGISCVVFGLAELAHLEEALAAEDAGPLPAEAREEIEAIYAGGP